MRLLICDTCRAVWPTERDPEHGGSRSDGEPCAYAWHGGICGGTVFPLHGRPHRAPASAAAGAWTEGESEPWHVVLGLPRGTQSLGVVRERFRELAKTSHPDVGGTHARMSAINSAYRAALYELGQRN